MGRHDPREDAPGGLRGVFEHRQDVHRVQTNAQVFARADVAHFEETEEIVSREDGLRFQGELDAEVPERRAELPEAARGEAEPLLGRNGVLLPALRAGSRRPDRVHAQGTTCSAAARLIAMKSPAARRGIDGVVLPAAHSR
jgi:hypothetical protein